MNAVALMAYASAALSLGLALAAVVRSPRALRPWPFVLGLVLLALESLGNGLTAGTQSGIVLWRWQQYRLLILALLPSVWLLFSLNYARGEAPESRKKWRRLLLAGLLLPGAVAIIFRAGLVTALRWNGQPSRAVLRLGWPGIVVYGVLLLASILILTNLERTFRAAVGTMRWRIKFMLLGMGVLFAVRIYTTSQALLFHQIDLSVERLNSAAMLIASVLMARSLRRSGHFAVDVYPSQSLLQNSFTFVAVGTYLVLVGLVARFAANFGFSASVGVTAFLALIALVALAVLLQSDKARLRLRLLISRNLQRPYYDYRTVWRRFTEGSAAQFTQVGLCRSFAGLLADVFQSLSVAIWLVDDQREMLVLAASTFIADAKAGELAPSRDQTHEIMGYFLDHPEPAELESMRSKAAGLLDRMHPREFTAGGTRMCAPLTSQGDVIGIVLVGDRVGGAPFTLQDRDMLWGVTSHVSASLRAMQLSQKLMQAKEMEAFQTMAAFFVHDLKNAASTLNLMLQNLPTHFDDPDFRADSLRGISNSVRHVNRLIERLSSLRHQQNLELRESDLNEVVAESLAGVEKGGGSSLTKNLQPLPKVMLDREHMHKVVTNLVLNATEAISPTGQVQIETSANAHWVILTVADDGCGMSPEFLSRGLFRPFQTTKKTGFGIGMFQSKMIVDSHGGRITVESDPGHGTTFRIFLPLPQPHP